MSVQILSWISGGLTFQNTQIVHKVSLFTYHKSQRLKIFTAPAVTPASWVRQDRAGLGRHIVQDESENIQGYKPGNCCRNPPEDVVLNEERISCGLEYKVLHEGLRGIFVSLQTIHVRLHLRKQSTSVSTTNIENNFQTLGFTSNWDWKSQVIRENKTKNWTIQTWIRRNLH